MHIRVTYASLIKIGVVIASLLLMAIPSQATESKGHAVWYTIASWEMNERPNAVILRDSTGNGFSGHIGMRVSPSGSNHVFPREDRQESFPQHIDKIADNDYLDPSFSDFAVAVRFKWDNKRHDMNLVQKGQGSPVGGLFKMKTTIPVLGQPKGHVKCLFRGSNGDSQVNSYETGYRLNDGTWHVVECERTIQGTLMFVDNVLVDINEHGPGEISNNWPIAIGGNSYCDRPDLMCNYFWGKIDYVRWLDG